MVLGLAVRSPPVVWPPITSPPAPNDAAALSAEDPKFPMRLVLLAPFSFRFQEHQTRSLEFPLEDSDPLCWNPLLHVASSAPCGCQLLPTIRKTRFLS